MKINEVAKLTGVTVRALHYYDEIGLLAPSEVTEAGYRLYVGDSRFTENIDRYGSGTAAFMSGAIEIYCGKSV